MLETTEVFGISHATLPNLLAEDSIEYPKTGRRVLITRDLVINIIESNAVKNGKGQDCLPDPFREVIYDLHLQRQWTEAALAFLPCFKLLGAVFC